MSRRRLADLAVSFAPSAERRQMPDFSIGVEQFSAAASQPTPPRTPEWDYLQSILGIEPFMIPALIPDLIYLLQYEGLEYVLNQIYPVPVAVGISLVPVEIPLEVVESKLRQATVRDAFQLGGLDNVINEIVFPGTQPVINSPDAMRTKQQYLNNIYQSGAARLAQFVAGADPNDPNTLIFNHASQDVHRQTQKIEIELIKNEPEVVEGNIQCQCGNTRVQTASKQLRSADEPPTVFARCVKCKRQWKFSQA
jgi:DNA-directed RNA polymerase subunit M/transcription elongation factor TFIIS